MLANYSVRLSFFALSVLLSLLTGTRVRAELAYAEYGPWPGIIQVASPAATSRLYYRRPLTLTPNDGQAWPRLCTLTCSDTGATYFASGLDSRIYQLFGGHEQMLYDAAQVEKRPPQIRCVRSVPGNPYLYFSAVPTPQNGAPLSDGTIYALNLRGNRVDYSIPVSQATVGGDWWGAFLPEVGKGGGFYLASRYDMYYVPRDRNEVRHVYRSKHKIVALVKQHDTSATTFLLYATSDGAILQLDLKRLQQRQVFQLPTKDVADVTVLAKRRPSRPRVPATGEFAERPVRPTTPGETPTASDPTTSRASKATLVGHVVAAGTSYFGQAELIDSRGRRLAQQRVDSSGRFRFVALAPGKYTVTLHRSPDEFYRSVVPGRQAVVLAAGQLRVVKFQLK